MYDTIVIQTLRAFRLADFRDSKLGILKMVFMFILIIKR